MVNAAGFAFLMILMALIYCGIVGLLVILNCRIGWHSWHYFDKEHRICVYCGKRQEWYVMGDFDRTSFWRDIE